MLKNQQLAQDAEKEMRSIAKARVAYEQLMEDIRGYCQQARKLREQATERVCKIVCVNS